MSQPLQLITAPEQATDRIVEMLERLLVDARQGRIVGLMTLVQDKEEFRYTRTNVTLESGIAHLTRVLHRLQLEWDRL